MDNLGCSIYLLRRTGRSSYYDNILAASTDVLRHYSRVFQPARFEVWEDAPTEGMGGHLYKTVDINPEESSEELLETVLAEIETGKRDNWIFRIKGNWKIPSRTQQGYISLNFDPSWRQTYGDISISLYATRDVQDLVNLFWSTTETRVELVDNFIQAVSEWNEKGKLFERVYFAAGTPSGSDAGSFVAVHYNKPTQLYDDIISTIESTDGSRIIRYLSPYRLSPLVKNLSKLEVASSRLKEITAHYEIQLSYGNSVSLVAEKIGSFAKAVKVLSESILLPAIRELRDMPSLIETMRRGIKESPIQFIQ